MNKVEYLKFINSLRACDILFTYNKKNSFSEAIANVSRLKNKELFRNVPNISHNALYLGNGIILEQTFGGMALHPITKYLDRKHNVYFKRLNVEFNTEDTITYALNLADKVGYAYIQVIWLFIKRVLNIKYVFDFQKRSEECCEAIIDIFKKANNINLLDNIKSYEATPMDLYLSDKLNDVGVTWKLE